MPASLSLSLHEVGGGEDRGAHMGVAMLITSSLQAVPQLRVLAAVDWRDPPRHAVPRCSSPSFSFTTLPQPKREQTTILVSNSNGAKQSLGLRGGPTLRYIGPTSGLREGGPT